MAEDPPHRTHTSFASGQTGAYDLALGSASVVSSGCTRCMAMLAQATDRISLPIFSVAFRPFFLLGGVWSALVLGLWIFAIVSVRSLSGRLSGVARPFQHAEEG